MDGIDLSCLKLAMNAAEPLQADTIARFVETFAPYGFDPGAMYPAYGLAEATLWPRAACRAPACRPQRQPCGLRRAVRRRRDGAGRRHRCGLWPRTRRRNASQSSIRRPRRRFPQAASARSGRAARTSQADTGATSRNRNDVPRPASAVQAARRHMAANRRSRISRESDGFYVTGRIKDLIIIRGVNHYPQDIERRCRMLIPPCAGTGARPSRSTDADGVEKLVVVQEVERTQRNGLDLEDNRRAHPRGGN